MAYNWAGQFLHFSYGKMRIGLDFWRVICENLRFSPEKSQAIFLISFLCRLEKSTHKWADFCGQKFGRFLTS